MPRFGIKSLLIAFVIIGVWLASFSGAADPTMSGAGSQIRKGMLIVVFVATGIAAACNQGRRRAFWSAFFATMLLLFVNDAGGYYFPNCLTIAVTWDNYLNPILGASDNVQPIVFWGIWHGLVLGVAAIAGFVSAWVYDQSRKSIPQDRV